MSTSLVAGGRMFSGRNFQISENERRYDEVYLVKTSSISEDPRVIWNTPGLPDGGDSYGTDLGAVVRSKTIRQAVEDDWQYWLVTVTFSTKPFGTDTAPGSKPGDRGGFNDQSPQTEHPSYRTTATQREVPAVSDKNGKPYRNSAGQLIHGAVKELCTYVMEIERNVLQTSASQQYTYLAGGGAVNSDTVFGGAAGTWRIAGWDSQNLWRNGTWYSKEKFTLHFREEGWKRYLLDEGYHIQNPSKPNTSLTMGSHEVPPEPVGNKDAYGSDMIGPQLLDGRGNPIKDVWANLTSDITAGQLDFLYLNLSDPGWPDPLTVVENHPAGMYIRVDQECMQVRQVSRSTATTGRLFVIRGKRGTTDVAHTTARVAANGALPFGLSLTRVNMAEVFLEFTEYNELPFLPLGLTGSIAFRQ